MLMTYWQLSNRLLEEERCGDYSGSAYMHSHAHNYNHQYSHHHYPINYSRSGSADIEKGSFIQFEKPEKIRTPQPKRSAKNLFNDPGEIIIISKLEASKLSGNYQHSLINSTASSVVSSDYKSLQISPLDFSHTSVNVF